jgi:hypothetical protein
MINLKNFLKDNDIQFDSEKKALRWIRLMKSNTLVRIGSSYFIDEDEMVILMKVYLTKQIALKKKRALQAKENFKRNALLRLEKKQKKAEDQIILNVKEKELSDKILKLESKLESKLEKKPPKKSE